MGRLGSGGSMINYNQNDKNAAEIARRSGDMGSSGIKILGKLSGGQRQRVLIARALLKQPQLCCLMSRLPVLIIGLKKIL